MAPGVAGGGVFSSRFDFDVALLLLVRAWIVKLEQ
jgi:hypothetical protein